MKVSSPAKVMFPDAGITKGELVGYYERVAETMLPHLRDRPITLQRFPQGLGGKGFMQKNASDYFPSFIRRIEVPKSDGTVAYPLVDDAEGLVYLANQNTITFHTWTSRSSRPGHPDRLVFDLDPPDDEADGARFAVEAMRESLAELAVSGYLLATGSKGFHVVVPVRPELGFEGADQLSQGVATLVTARHPDRLTTEFLKRNRRGRVFVDWLRNRWSATSVVPWSVRARPTAPVATPLSWEELASTASGDWTLARIDERLSGPDVWAGFGEHESDPVGLAARVAEELERAGLELEPFDRFGRRPQEG